MRPSPARERVFAVVAAHPGVTLACAAKLLSCDPSTVTYHVRRLARERRVVVQASPRAMHLFPARGASCPVARGALAGLTGPRRRDVLGALARGASTIEEVAHLAGVKTAEAWRALSVASDAGIVREERGAWALVPESAECVLRVLSDGACEHQARAGFHSGQFASISEATLAAER